MGEMVTREEEGGVDVRAEEGVVEVRREEEGGIEVREVEVEGVVEVREDEEGAGLGVCGGLAGSWLEELEQRRVVMLLKCKMLNSLACKHSGEARLALTWRSELEVISRVQDGLSGGVSSSYGGRTVTWRRGWWWWRALWFQLGQREDRST